MPTVLSHYLESIVSSLRLDLSEEREISSELETHIEDRVQELTEAGLSEEVAAKACIGLLGSTKLVARQLYEAHSQGNWKQVLLSAMPHLLFGLLFALNWWYHIGWLSGLLALTLGTTAYGCWRGKPTWVFSWLGYSLLPVLVAGILLLYLPKGWSLLVLPLYFLLALWWLGYIVVQTVKRDWLFTSLTLLPIPIIIGWFLAVAPAGKPDENSLQLAYDFAPWIGLSFLVLALIIATFLRLRQRWPRIALLSTSGLLTLTMIAFYTNGKLSLPAFLFLILAMWGIFLIPSALERRIRKRVTTKTKEPPGMISNTGEVLDAKGDCYN